MDFTNFFVLIIGLSVLLLINNVHGEEDKKVPLKEIQDSQDIRDAKSITDNSNIAEHRDEPARRSQIPEKVIVLNQIIYNVTKKLQNKITKSHRNPRLMDAELENKDDLDSNPRQAKYHVVLHNGTMDICSATILDDTHLLSSAHCFIDSDNDPYGEKLTVLIGTNKLQDLYTQNTLRVKTVYVPSEYNRTLAFNNVGDIAVVKLTGMLGLDKDHRIAKINLPTAESDGSYDLYEGKKGTVAGYAETNLEHGPQSLYDLDARTLEILFPRKFINLKANVLKQSECEVAWPSINIASSQICGKSQHYHGICMFGRGNTLVHNNTAIGVVGLSYVTCNDGYRHFARPTIYSRVSSYIEFITDAMADKTSDKIRTFDILNV